MLHARVVGHAHSTVQHPSLRGVRLMLCESIDETKRGLGSYFLAADWLGAGPGSEVFVSTDGEAASRRIGNTKTPLRNVILGIIDETAEELP